MFALMFVLQIRHACNHVPAVPTEESRFAAVAGISVLRSRIVIGLTAHGVWLLGVVAVRVTRSDVTRGAVAVDSRSAVTDVIDFS